MGMWKKNNWKLLTETYFAIFDFGSSSESAAASPFMAGLEKCFFKRKKWIKVFPTFLELFFAYSGFSSTLGSGATTATGFGAAAAVWKWGNILKNRKHVFPNQKKVQAQYIETVGDREYVLSGFFQAVKLYISETVN